MLPLLLLIIACILWIEELKIIVQNAYDRALDAFQNILIVLSFKEQKIDKLNRLLDRVENRIHYLHEELEQKNDRIDEYRAKNRYLKKQIENDFEFQHSKYRAALKDLEEHIEELEKEKVLIGEHRDLVQKHCDEAWEHFNRATKEIERLNAVVLDLTERVVAYEN